ncbi:hypothetical protein VN12_06185 [Pirellula sp. SH-Sr6A]|nr:hypothetical protein VN12_06185 [Pirellula sp. SH-Sr6A]
MKRSMSASTTNVETRVNVSRAVGRYLRAVEHFEAASREFNEACSGLRDQLVEPSRFVTKIDFKHYLVTSDQERNFEVEELELL